MGEPQPTRAHGARTRVLRGLPSTPPAPRPAGRDELIVHAARVAGRLAARATLGEGVLPPVAHGEVALELRHLLPLVDDSVFDQHLARLESAARFVTSAETAQAADLFAYASAAWDAGLDPADFAADVEAFRTSVIEHWDQALLQAVVDLVHAERSAPVADGDGTAYAPAEAVEDFECAVGLGVVAIVRGAIPRPLVRADRAGRTGREGR